MHDLPATNVYINNVFIFCVPHPRTTFVLPFAQLRRQSQFNARKKFHYAIMCVRAMVRIKRLRYTLEPLKVEDAMCDPYRVKILRKVQPLIWLSLTLDDIWVMDFFFCLQVIDGCAFRVYGHWVKKGEGQNRAALFENTPRTELHAIYLANLSRWCRVAARPPIPFPTNH